MPDSSKTSGGPPPKDDVLLEHVAERKRLYLLKHPETARGTAGAHAKHASASADSAFADDAASKTGQSKRSVQVDVQIAESIPEDVREQLHDSAIADAKTDQESAADTTH